MLGYNKPLYILPFDHRSSFLKIIFGSKIKTKKRKKIIKEYKKVIFEGYLLARKKIKNKNHTGILIDQEYGLSIIKEAKKKKIIFALSTEKSGEKEYHFEYGKNFSKHLLKYKPNFAKALVRYNPYQPNKISLKNLKILSDFCQKKKIKLIVEVLLPKAEKKSMILAINQMQTNGIEPDVWKLEGLDKSSDWSKVINQVRAGKRKKVGIIVLGRGENKTKVYQWLKLARKHKGIIGFAVGRTIWAEPILKYHQKKINRQKAIKIIANNYLELIKFWEQGRR